MKPDRIFIGWDTAALDGIIKHLLQHRLSGLELNLADCLLVFSGGRAGRRLLERLALVAKEKGLVLVPPKIVTVGTFPESVYKPDQPVASQLESELAWVRALSAIKPESVKSIIGRIPESTEVTSWLPIARNIAKLHAELAANLLTFLDAGQKISQMPNAPDDGRWQVLEEACELYLAELSKVKLVDRHDARAMAIESGNINYSGTVILCAVRDLTEVSKRFIDSLTCDVISIVHAPDSEAKAFDDYGCVEPSAWISRDLNIDSAKISPAINAVDQALLVLQTINNLKGKYHQSEITVGQTDPILLPYLETIFSDAGLNLHNPGGRPLAETGTVRLISLIGRYLSHQKMSDLFSLARFPEFETVIIESLKSQAIESIDSVTAKLDAYQKEHLQAYSSTIPKVTDSQSIFVQAVIVAVNEVLAPFREPNKRLDYWLQDFRDLLFKIYPDQQTVSDELEAARTSLESITDCAQELLPVLSGDAALALLVRLFQEVALPSERSSQDIETLGWLELQLDDAPALIVCGMNEESVPESVNSDSFLPEGVRKFLGLLDNDRRYARDAFVLTALNHSVPNLTLIYGTLDSKGNPLTPSRLLLSCSKNVFVERVEKLYLSTPTEFKMIGQSAARTLVPKWQVPPLPKKLAGPIESLSVTGFGDYLRCPYRFYLRHVLKLNKSDDAMLEMDGALFGSLGHAVLAEFTKNDTAQIADVQLIRNRLNQILDQKFSDRFGNSPLPAVIIQREQLRKRLNLFAIWQAGWRSAGWQTKYTEYDVGATASRFNIDRLPFDITGRIDRIDFNIAEKSWAVFDYKFGENVEGADEAHQKNEEWINLQLPLYHHLLRRAGFQETIKLGYLRLSPGVSTETIDSFASWGDVELESALDMAFAIVRKIRQQEFWPANQDLGYADEYQVILGSDLFVEEAESEFGQA